MNPDLVVVVSGIPFLRFVNNARQQTLFAPEGEHEKASGRRFQNDLDPSYMFYVGSCTACGVGCNTPHSRAHPLCLSHISHLTSICHAIPRRVQPVSRASPASRAVANLSLVAVGRHISLDGVLRLSALFRQWKLVNRGTKYSTVSRRIESRHLAGRHLRGIASQVIVPGPSGFSTRN